MQTLVITALLAVFGWFGAEPRANGTIEGKVMVRQLPRQRVANQYPGAGNAGARDLKPLPVVAYLAGTVGSTDFPASAAPVMAQRDTSFQPHLIIVPAGTTVRFPNEDKFFHNVFSYSKTKRFDLGRYPRGEAKSVTFDETGAVTVLCEIHKWMRAAIVVVENRYFATVDESGSFRIADVPPGKYQLVFWHPERGRKTFDVTVPASGSVRVDAAF
jgi:plastocyanin